MRSALGRMTVGCESRGEDLSGILGGSVFNGVRYPAFR